VSHDAGIEINMSCHMLHVICLVLLYALFGLVLSYFYDKAKTRKREGNNTTPRQHMTRQSKDKEKDEDNNKGPYGGCRTDC